MGSGSLPAQDLPTRLVAVAARGLDAGQIAPRLRHYATPVFARVHQDQVLADPRTLLDGDEEILVAAFCAALRRGGKRPPMLNITLGTAGHIDHGKTALVKSLTGCETDRLKEEKERGMSIDLGYAPCRIADLEVGMVDVPGHENFIKTMVAGASGMDGVILVVAADDGIMPQTREHLDILTLLGLRHGLVALTKVDRVDSERRPAGASRPGRPAARHVSRGAPVLPLSNVTGQGFDPFLEALQALVHAIRPRRTDGVFRLPSDRAFSAKGFGTVVAGIPIAGSASLGDEVVLLPQNITSRIRRIEVYGQPGEPCLPASAPR